MTEATKPIPEDPELSLIFPPEKSMSGRNSVYRFCDAKQQQASYAVCLHTLQAIDENRLASDRFPECQRAYCHGNCVAADMRKEERTAGQALYYVERRREIIEPVQLKVADDHSQSSGKYDLNNESYARGWAQVGSRIHGESRPKPTRNIGPIKKALGFVEHDSAAVLNSMIEKEQKAKPAPAAPVTASGASIKPEPGESPLAFAKRRKALLEAQQ